MIPLLVALAAVVLTASGPSPSGGVEAVQRPSPVDSAIPRGSKPTSERPKRSPKGAPAAPVETVTPSVPKVSSPNAVSSTPPPVLPKPAPPLPVASATELTAFALEDSMLRPTTVVASESAVDGGAGQPSDKPRGFTTSNDDDTTVIVRTATLAAEPERITFRRRPTPPKKTAAFIFGYRHFQIQDALLRRQSWHMASLELTPLRRYVRLNFMTEFGWEGGEAARNHDRADFMVLEKTGIGVQYPMWVTPFIEFQGGAGVTRVEIFEHNELVFTYTLGLDVGAQWAVTQWLFLHAALGWIRPTLRHPSGSVHYDRVAFKVGFGF